MSSTRDLSGSELGGYYLERQLGAGASATVYLARDGGGNSVAFKLLAPGADLGQRDGDARERLRSEALALQRVNVPGVAAVMDLEVDGVEAFIVTEYIPGPTLAEEVRAGGAWQREDALELGTLLASTLRAVHESGICHRDIKPANVILGPNGPVLIDFGISSVLENTDGLTRTGLVVGTPGFISPEIIEGQKADFSDDWWALAALLLFVVTGRPPFGTGSPTVIVSRILSGNPDVGGLEEPLAEVFRGVLAPQNQRSADFVELLHALEVGVDTEETAATALLTPAIPNESGYTTVMPQELNGRYSPAGIEIPAAGVESSPEWSAEETGGVADTWGDADLPATQTTAEPDVTGVTEEKSGTKPAPGMLPFLGLAGTLAWAAWIPGQPAVSGVIAVIGFWVAAVAGWHWRSTRIILSLPAAFIKGLASTLPAAVIVAAALFLAGEILYDNTVTLPTELPDTILIFGTIVPKRVYVAQVLSGVALLVAWWIPLSAPLRVGARRMLRAALPTPLRRLILGMLLLGLATAAFILV
ncbi:serine/threonine-protein kinase [Mobiluncus sp.]|uniref:serine/threonine protein kinase n=1 Tax=Mobiluncus sp. TaxID=47293 RepID=UPI002A912960|nr:serine/threonine-protein kinase [Mobiluncus sp.]MDY6077641.1 serine/threonine-protein kinase [Mobiluncus sp.]